MRLTKTCKTTHTHTHTHTARKRLLQFSVLLIIVFFSTIACKDDLQEEEFNATLTETSSKQFSSQQEKNYSLKKGLYLSLKDFAIKAKKTKTKTFYDTYGKLNVKAAKIASFGDSLDDLKDFILVVPFEREDLINKRVVIGYYKDGKRHYRIYLRANIKKYLKQKDHPYFIKHLKGIFAMAYPNNSISSVSRGYCDYSLVYEDGCDAVYYSECYGYNFITTCDDKGNEEDDDWNWDEYDGEVIDIDEVVVTAEGNQDDEEDTVDVGYEDDYDWDVEEDEQLDEDEESGSGEDTNDVVTPCQTIAQKIADSTYQAKVAFLRTKFNLHHETGFSENTSGTFTALTAAGANAMYLPISSGIIGYMHVHQNDYEDSNGDLKKPYKIFSPADVIMFLRIARQAAEDGTDLEDIYGAMYSGDRNYILKFTGNGGDLPSDADMHNMLVNSKPWRDRFKDEIKNYDDYDKEKMFINFMNSIMGVEGVSLYRVNNNGTIKEVRPKWNNTSITIVPCE